MTTKIPEQLNTLINNDIIHLTHNNKNKNNLDGIVLFNNNVIHNTNGYPNYYWDLLNSSEELYRNCSTTIGIKLFICSVNFVVIN